jgi:hypothetical protein
MPPRACGALAASEVSRDLWSKFDRAAADGFTADFDAALRKQFLDIAKAQRKSEVQLTACRMTSAGNRCRLNEIDAI